MGVRAALLVAVFAAACAHTPRPATSAGMHDANGWRVSTRGAVSALAIAGQKLWFCDEDGLHQLEVSTARALTSSGPCPPAPAPASSAPEVTVRTPDLGPDDIVEIEGQAMSYPIAGHARDWASDGGQVVIVGTGSEVLELLPATEKRVRLSDHGATRVAVGGGWAAWWDGAAITAHRL